MDINLGYYNRICPLLKNEWFKGGVEPNRRASPYKWVGCQRIVSLIGNSAGRQSTASFSIIRYQSIASRGLPNSILFLSSHRRQKDYQRSTEKCFYETQERFVSSFSVLRFLDQLQIVTLNVTYRLTVVEPKLDHRKLSRASNILSYKR